MSDENIPQGEPQGQPAEVSSATGDERTWGMWAHLSSLAGFIGVPFGHIIGPLVIWLVKKDTMPYVDRQGKESLNFQISMTIYSIVAGVLVLVVVGFILLLGLIILDVVCVIIAGVKASKGEEYSYPVTIRFLK